MYYNKITGKVTEFRFRIKTEEEFLNHYGGDWKQRIRYGWNDEGQMDHLYGLDLVFKTDKDFILDFNFTHYLDDSSHGRDWTISFEMVIENDAQDFNVMYNLKKQLVYD